MGIFSRLSDIINSNLSAMLDRAEDPEKIVRLIIQEMEDTLIEVRSRAARGIADRKEIERKRAEFEKRAKEWEGKAEFAISLGRDDLAKGAIAAKRKANEMIVLFDEELNALAEITARTDDDLAKLQSKLKEAKTRQRSMEMRHVNASNSVRINRQLHDGRIDEALAKYDHYERRIDEIEGEAESWTVQSKNRPRSLEQEFAELEAEEGVNEELAALKEKIAQRNPAKTG